MNPTGTKSITANGTYDVREYEYADVNVSQPTGNISKTLFADQTIQIDVTDYATATLNIIDTCEIDIVLTEGRLSPTMAFAADGKVLIYWGDGDADLVQGNNLASLLVANHTYQKPGKYTISIGRSVTSTATIRIFSDQSYSKLLYDSASANSMVYQNSIKEVRIGKDYVEVRNNSAFYNCYSLEKVEIYDSHTSIGNHTFRNCWSLINVHLPSSLTGTLTGTFRGCYSLQSVDLPSGITALGDYVFDSCGALTSVVIPNAVTSIGQYAFSNNYSLRSVNIPNNVTTIGDKAFSGCNSLTTITIPAAVTSIGSNAFASIYGLKEVHIKPTTPPTLTDDQIFTGLPSDCVIYVPSAQLNTYKTATYWSTYASYMQGE